MLARRLVHAPRIPPTRPLRPPSLIAPQQPPRPRPFTQHTPLLLLARAARPQLPYLAQPAFRAQHPGFLGPNPQLARLLSTETRQYVREQVALAAKWTAIAWTFAVLGAIAFTGYAIEVEERRQASPEEWRFWTRWGLRAARQQLRVGDEGRGVVDWAAVGSGMRRCLSRLEDPSLDGTGLEEQAEGGLLIPGAGKAGFDISGKSWPWRAGYFEVIMACAAAAEHLDGMVLDTTRSMVFPREVMIGPSNPDPRPIPPYMAAVAAAPREENCTRPFDPPEKYYTRVLTTKGFTTRQKLDAALAYANWLEFQGLDGSAEEVYRWGVDIARAGLPLALNPDDVIDSQTSVLRSHDATATLGATANLLRSITSLAIHHARTGDVSAALPILLSVLRAQRSAPLSPYSDTQLPQQPAQEAAQKTDIAATLHFFRTFLQPPKFPPPPPSGDLPLTRTSERPSCEESELMLYIGEILFATSPQSSEGLGWTRQAVTVAEANLQAGGGAVGFSAEAKEAKGKCRACLATGVENWGIMLERMLEQEQRLSAVDGGVSSREAGWFEWKGWFGGDGGAKGRVLGELRTGVLEAEVERVEALRERIVREGIGEEMERARGAGGGGASTGVWIG
ncbi:hypothetical protein LTR08_000457 [Meristemomyces frigidus]|nr:hypothetical protein LTR08_000457 [Meristemomyces frigidus]